MSSIADEKSQQIVRFREQEETVVSKIDQVIAKEMDKVNPNIRILVKNFRKRRFTQQYEEAK